MRTIRIFIKVTFEKQVKIKKSCTNVVSTNKKKMKNIIITLLLAVLLINCSAKNAVNGTALKLLESPITKGCGNITVVQKIESINGMGTYVILKLEKSKIDFIASQFQTFKVQNNSLIDGKIEVLNQETLNNYCTDAIHHFIEVTQSFKLIKGTVKARIVEYYPNMEIMGTIPYSVEVILEQAVFQHSEKIYTILNSTNKCNF